MCVRVHAQWRACLCLCLPISLKRKWTGMEGRLQNAGYYSSVFASVWLHAYGFEVW